MLRTAVLVFAIAMIVTGAGVCLFGPLPPGLYLTGMGALILLGTLFERRYRTNEHPHAQWQSTGERFADPQTGEILDVEYDPASGERRYVKTKGSK